MNQICYILLKNTIPDKNSRNVLIGFVKYYYKIVLFNTEMKYPTIWNWKWLIINQEIWYLIGIQFIFTLINILFYSFKINSLFILISFKYVDQLIITSFY